jgi:hypothetical protein
MATSERFDSVVVGTVRSVNDRGLKLDGYDSWFNVSRFAVGVVLPERGETVACTLDKAGFLRCVGPADGATPTAPPVRGGSDAATAAAPSTKDRTITRLACLKAAAEFGAARPNLKSGDVLAIAASWERWITREQETTYDLDAADDDAAF